MRPQIDRLVVSIVSLVADGNADAHDWILSDAFIVYKKDAELAHSSTHYKKQRHALQHVAKREDQPVLVVEEHKHVRHKHTPCHVWDQNPDSTAIQNHPALQQIRKISCLILVWKKLHGQQGNILKYVQ